MSGRAKTALGVLLARPLIAALAVGFLLLGTHRQKTPVTHRTEHVGFTDQQQMCGAAAPAGAVSAASSGTRPPRESDEVETWAAPDRGPVAITGGDRGGPLGQPTAQGLRA